MAGGRARVGCVEGWRLGLVDGRDGVWCGCGVGGMRCEWWRGVNVGWMCRVCVWGGVAWRVACAGVGLAWCVWWVGWYRGGGGGCVWCRVVGGGVCVVRVGGGLVVLAVIALACLDGRSGAVAIAL